MTEPGAEITLKGDLLRPTRVVRLSEDRIEVGDEHGNLRQTLMVGTINRVHLETDWSKMTRMHRCVCTISGTDGRIRISDWQGPDYRIFVRRLHSRLLETGQEVAFRTGYRMMSLVSLAIVGAVLFGVYWAFTTESEAIDTARRWTIAILCLGFGTPVFWLTRALAARPYDPANIPRGLLPGSQPEQTPHV